MSYEIEDARVAVRRGAELLDEKKPGWRDHLELSWLRMARCRKCILGQTYGDYFIAIQNLWPSLDRREANSLAVMYGFQVPSSLLDAPEQSLSDEDRKTAQRRQYRCLRRAWVYLLKS